MPTELHRAGQLKTPFGPRGVQSQRIDEVMIRATDAGPAGLIGEPGPDDPQVRRSVWIRGEAGWLIDALISLLPPNMPFASRIDELTCEVGGTHDFLNLSP